MVLVEVQGLPPGLEVHQLLSGREVAKDHRTNLTHRFARQMANYSYLLVDKESRLSLAIDPCWDVDGFCAHAEEMKCSVAVAVFTHCHYDHVGGVVPKSMTGASQDIKVPGIADFVARDIEVGVGAHDARRAAKQARIPIDSVRELDDEDTVEFGRFSVKVISTPGHTPGSVCFWIGNAVFTGDTLFIGSCGRVDLPESNPTNMLQSLTRLASLPKHTFVFPGHNYALPAHSTISQEQETNVMMVQAMERFQRSGNLNTEPVAAVLPLPDYLGVVRRVFESHSKNHDHEPPKYKVDQLESHF